LEENTVAKLAMAGAVLDAAPQRRGSGLASVKEAEQFLSLSRSTVYGLMDSGELRYVKIGKSRRIPWEALDELVRRRTVNP
jgi:excisionase family DNA binding protein